MSSIAITDELRPVIQLYARACQRPPHEDPHHKSRFRLAVASSFPVICTAFPCSAFSLPCYRITAKIAYKPLIRRDKKSNKMPQNREEKFSFPVLCLFRVDNRESGCIRSLAEIFDDIPTRRLSA
ncbi:MAG: hypothetical protein ABIO86_17525 [Sphingomonas sp.]